ncbi:hypothetical protein GCM10029963_36810 [Micromonospora andamanensis]
MPGSPVIDSAPMEVPWYAMYRLTTLCFVGLPTRLKYARASFQAVSTASEPPVVKKTRFRSPGVSAAIFSASSTAFGWAYDQSGK